MDFKDCTIIVPVIRETDLFEQVIRIILDTCNLKDIREFIIVIHPQYTAEESRRSISRMQEKCFELGVDYHVLEQKLPGMGGAIRDALDMAAGSHTIIQNSDLALDPKLVSDLIEYAKAKPDEVIDVSRYIKGGGTGNEYKILKRLWNVLAQRYCALLFHSHLTDYTYLYRICPTSYYQAIEWVELKHPFALEVTLKFLRLGLNFHEIPGKQVGGSQSGYRETMLYLPTSLKVRFMNKSKILKPGMSLDPQKNCAKPVPYGKE